MKKIVALVAFCLIFPANAQIVRSDLSLLQGTPAFSDKESMDPYWDLAWHGRVASYGDPDSQFFVAQVYEQGKLVPRDLARAIHFYQMAAIQGHLESCRKLAELVPAEAEYWYTKAAEQGDPQAQLHLARYYEEQGNTDKAILWMERSLRFLFPDVQDLTAVSPDLKRLKGET